MPRLPRWSPARWVVVVGASAALLLGSVILLTFPMGRDQAIFVVAAEVIHGGGMPYRDAWDMKPPGIFLAYLVARILFGPGGFAPRLLEAVLLVGTALSIWRLQARAGLAEEDSLPIAARGGASAATGPPAFEVGAGAALLYVAWHLRLDYWHTGQPEGFGGMFGVWALLLCGPGVASIRPGRAFGAGLLLGLASMMKPTFALDVALLGLWIAAAARPRAAAPLALVAGAALGAVGPLVWIFAGGAWPELLWTFTRFLPGYAALDLSDGGGVISATLSEASRQVGWLGLVGMGLGLFALRRAGPRRALLLMATAFVGVQLVGVAAQGKFFAYHYAGALPFAALLASTGLGELLAAVWVRVAPPRRAALAAAAVAAGAIGVCDEGVPRPFRGSFLERSIDRLLALPRFAEKRPELERQLTKTWDYNLPGAREAAAWIATNTPPGSTLLVWGFEPELHVFADRPPASRYFYSVPARCAWSLADTRPLLLSELAASTPGAVAVGKKDALPWVTGDRATSAEALATFPELAAWLAEHYAGPTTFPGLDVYLRRDLTPGSPPASAPR